MKNIRFFKTLKEYENFVYSQVIHTFSVHPFYSGLVSFVMENRTPLFYEQSDPSEYAHFTQYFNFELLRTYENDFIRDMFFMHDFTHMVFDNPINVRRMTFEQFEEISNYNEYTASNETEVFTYYRIPGLREKSLPYPILYDVLKEKYPNGLTVEELLALRTRIILNEEDGDLGGHPDAPAILTHLRKYRENNKVWCKLWFDSFPVLDAPYFKKRLTLPLLSYDMYLSRYQYTNTEEKYQKNILENIRVGMQAAGINDLPATFNECEDAVKMLEGKIIMKDTAEAFHDYYTNSKK